MASIEVEQDKRDIPAHKIRAIAVEAWTTERSVRNYIAGRPMKPILSSRIESVMRAEGYER